MNQTQQSEQQYKELTKDYISCIITAMCVSHSDYHGKFTKKVAKELSSDIIEEININLEPLTQDDIGVYIELKPTSNIKISNVKSLDMFKFTVTEFREVTENEYGLVVRFAGIKGKKKKNIRFTDNGLTKNKNGVKYEISMLIPN